MNWKVLHDEKHRFLHWGPKDIAFDSWVEYFTEKDVLFDVVGSNRTGKWTIYKHQIFTHINYAIPTRCCLNDQED